MIDVVLTVLGVAGFLESEALHAHICSIDDNSLVQGLGRNDILHASDKLKLIFVKLLDMADCGCAVGGLLVVFLEEGTDYFRELAVLVNVLQMH